MGIRRPGRSIHENSFGEVESGPKKTTKLARKAKVTAPTEMLKLSWRNFRKKSWIKMALISGTIRMSQGSLE